MPNPAGRPPKLPIEHGELRTYNYYGCRCDKCKAAKHVYSKQHPIKESRHGLPGTYNRGCRCEPCHKAFLAWRRSPKQTNRVNRTNRFWRERGKVRRQELLNALKNVPCADCTNRFPPICMDFDHVRGKKCFSLAYGLSKRISMARIFAEIEKCEVVCANCHRIRTDKRRGGISSTLLPPSV